MRTPKTGYVLILTPDSMYTAMEGCPPIQDEISRASVSRKSVADRIRQVRRDGQPINQFGCVAHG